MWPRHFLRHFHVKLAVAFVERWFLWKFSIAKIDKYKARSLPNWGKKIDIRIMTSVYFDIHINQMISRLKKGSGIK